MNNFQASPTSIILDTETTGLREPQPIEIAFIQLASTGIVNTETKGIYLQRFKPTKAIEAGALKTHGITAASLVEMPEYKLSKVPFPADLKYIIAHNAAYDMKVLKCAGSGYSPKVDLPVVEICTLKLARKLWPELKGAENRLFAFCSYNSLLPRGCCWLTF